MINEFLIKNVAVVSPTDVTIKDVYIKDQLIADLGAKLDYPSATTIDGSNKHLFPGLIDDQVHFREPGLTHKATIASESLAAVAGGVTSYLEMPNTKPPTINQAALDAKLNIAKDSSHANYGFYLGTTGDNIAEISSAKEYGACGIKVFLGASTGNLLVDEQDKLDAVFKAVPERMVLTAHCEDFQAINCREDYFLAEYGQHLPMEFHSIIRDDQSCKKATVRAIKLARKHNTRFHVLHLTTAIEMELFDTCDVTDKLITAEVCIHHLFLNDTNYHKRQGLIKCNPAIKSKADQAALFNAIKENKIDVIATDHAPHTLNEKTNSQLYKDIPAGLPLVQYSLPTLLELVTKGNLTLSDIARLGAYNPAQLFNIERRGEIKIGNYADLVLVDLNAPSQVTAEQLLYKANWSPFTGQSFSSSICEVWVSGVHKLKQGKVCLDHRGMQLVYNY